MNILDDLEEYTKLISNMGSSTKNDDVDNKLSKLKEKLDIHLSELNTIKDNHENHKNDIDSRLSQLSIDIEINKRDTLNLTDNHILSIEGLSKELNELKDYRQNMEDYKKVTNDRIEKLVKLFLSINK